MFTLPCHKHNPIKVTLKNGEVILARITRFNEATGKVCWIDKGEKWKGSTHCSRIVKATPEEVLAWSKAHEVAMAPVDPILAGYELGKTKRGPMMMEGYYFAVPVYHNGKKIGEIVDEGQGGDVIFNAKYQWGTELPFREVVRKWAMTNGASGTYLEELSELWAWWDEARPKGKDAKTFFKEQNEEMAKLFPGPRPEIKQNPIHTGDLALVKGQI
jgi:hypothetical protein